MFFLAFVFAYFYLRSLNNGGHWRPPRRRSAPGLRRRDRRPVRRSAPRLFAYATGPPERARTWLPDGGDRAGARRSPAASFRGSSGPTSVSVPSTAAMRACSSAGRCCSRCSCSSPCTGWRSSSRPALRHRAARGGLRPARPRRRVLLLDAARGRRRDHLGDPLPALRTGVVDAKPLLDWTGGPAFAWVVGAALLYWLGGRHGRAHSHGAGGRRWRTRVPSSPVWRRSSIALDSRIDELAEELLWVHMVQHILLLVVAPPLLALARPWNRMWHGLPLAFRRRTAGVACRSPRLAPLRTGGSVLQDPLRRWLAFNVTFVAWHIPGAYDATLHSQLRSRARARDVLRDGAAVLDAGDRLAPWRSPLSRGARAPSTRTRDVGQLGRSRSPSRCRRRRSTPRMRRRPADQAGSRRSQISSWPPG